MLSGRIYAEVRAPSTVGVAFSNPNAVPSVLSFFFTDSDGRDIGFGTTTISPNGQIARFLDQPPFNAPAGLRGSMSFTSTAPVAAIAVLGYLNERGVFLMPQDPVLELPNAGHAIIPYFIAGSVAGGNTSGDVKTTDIVILNTTDQPLSGTFTFFGQGSGSTEALPVNITIEGQTASTFSYSIPTRSSRRYAMSRTATTLYRGSIQMNPGSGTAAPTTFALESVTRNGVIVGQESIPGQRPSRALRAFVSGFVLNPFGGFIESAMFAIANPSPSPVAVTLELENPFSRTTVTVPPRGQVASSIEATFGLTIQQPYAGSLRILADSAVSAIVFQDFPNHDFTFTREPFDESAASTPVVLPHLPSGFQSYVTRIRVFRASSTQATTGVIRFFSQAGDPIDPNTLQ